MSGVTLQRVSGRRIESWPCAPGADISLESIFSGLADVRQAHSAVDRPVRIISKQGAPRWVLPADARRAIPVLQSWRPYSVKSRVKWSAIVGSCRLGALKLLPGVLGGDLKCDLSYWGHHLPEYWDSWTIVAYVGNPSSTRKTLLFFVNERDQVRAVVKVPMCPAAKAAIVNESRVLTQIQNRLTLPQILFSDDSAGIAAQSWIQGSQVPRSFRKEHLELLMQLASSESRVRLIDSREQLGARIAASASIAGPSLLRKALSLLNVQDDIPECVVHGDFTPWNLRRISDGTLTAIDWEWSELAGFPWQDICRYFYLQAYLFRERGNIWNRISTHRLLCEYRGRLNLSSAAVRGLTAHFLIKLVCKAHEEGDSGKVSFGLARIQELLNEQNERPRL